MILRYFFVLEIVIVWYELIMIILALIMLVCLFRTSKIKLYQRSFRIILLLILILAIFLRVYRYGTSMGVNADEAMGGYNAWCLAHYGVSMWLHSYPVYLIAWGSGMNILYPLLTIPLIKLCGLSIFTYRLPLVFLSIMALFIVTYVLINYKMAPQRLLILIALLALSPVTIINNRWAVESNLMPVVYLLVFSCFVMFLKKQQIGWLILFNVCLCLGAYTYAANWLVLGLFFVLIHWWLWHTKRLSLTQLGIVVGIDILLTWPLLLFIYVNYISHQALQIGNLTITKLLGTRLSDSWCFSAKTSPLVAIIKNIGALLALLFKGQYDSQVGSLLPFYAFYPLTMLLMVIGLGYSLFNKIHDDLTMFMLLFLLAALPTIIVTTPNYIHDNLLILPLLYFAAVGGDLLLQKCCWRWSYGILIGVSMLVFAGNYFGMSRTALTIMPVKTFYGYWVGNNYQQALKIAQQHAKANQAINIIDARKNRNFIFTAFDDPISPYQFNRGMHLYLTKHNNLNCHWGRYYFATKLKQHSQPAVYILKGKYRHFKSLRHYHHQVIKPYVVYWP